MEYNRKWITDNAVDIIKGYEDGVLTLRGLHYQLVGRGMTNDIPHYKKTVSAMIKARWDGLVRFEVFSDHDRETIGETDIEETVLENEIESSKRYITHWMESYTGNKWENQPFIPEVWIEKKALQGLFEPICRRMGIALSPCKGYPSLTFLNEAKQRFREILNEGKTPIILYFGDYDATGEDIPRSIKENLRNLGINIEVKRISLLEDQVIEMGLPHAPTKPGDTRGKNWGGFGQVELDAVDPKVLSEMCSDAIDEYFDFELYKELQERIDGERDEYRSQLKDFVNNLSD